MTGRNAPVRSKYASQLNAMVAELLSGLFHIHGLQVDDFLTAQVRA